MKQILLTCSAVPKKDGIFPKLYMQTLGACISLRFLLLCFFFMLLGLPVVASHFKGGHISYKYLGEGRYEFLIKSYWDKDEIGSVIPRYQGYPELENSVKTVSQTLLPDGITVEHQQRQVAKWNKPGLYEVSWKSCCRATGANFDNNALGLFATVHYSATVPSSSPEFRDLPIFNFEAGEPVHYSLNMVDPDGHEQEFSLEKPYGSSEDVYEKMLETGFEISTDGTFLWEKPLAGTWLVNVKVREKMNGVYTGAYIVRDFLIKVAVCELHAPSYSIVSSPCTGSNNGKITLSAPEGTSPFSYSLDNGKTFQSSSEFEGLSPGSYTGVVVDSKGCISQHVHIKLEEAPLPEVTLSLPSTICSNAGAIALSGGSPDGGIYQGPGVQDGFFYPDVAGIGTHTLSYIYTDSNGCSNTASEIITVNEAPIATAEADQTTIYYGYDPLSCTTLTAGATDGSAPYTYKWSTGESTQTIKICPTVTTTYVLTVMDARGCSASSQITITVYDVRAEKTNNKHEYVNVCKNGKTMTFKQEHVEKELEKGATLGDCESGSTQGNTTLAVNSSKSMVVADPATAVKPEILVYPNPATQGKQLKVSSNVAETIQVDIIDMAGRVVKKLHEGDIAANQEVVLEPGLISGRKSIYILRVTTTRELLYFKILMP